MGSEGLDKFGSWSGGGRVLCAVRVSGCTVMGLKNLLAQEAPQGVLGPGFLGLGRATFKGGTAWALDIESVFGGRTWRFAWWGWTDSGLRF